jgi:CHAT domain-containing protein
MDPEALRQLAALPGTRVELQQVQTALGASEDALLLAERMTETAIRSSDLSRTRILHLATHGFTSEEAGSLAEPGLVFTPPDAAGPEDDGYLAASEVVGMNLALAQWVILSACNTASPSGQPGETGLSGLAQAFLYAGAESLLVSHWPVFDEIAPLITVETLKAARTGTPRAEALQAAMRKVREDLALDADHPAVWAPFSLVGEGN